MFGILNNFQNSYEDIKVSRAIIPTTKEIKIMCQCKQEIANKTGVSSYVEFYMVKKTPIFMTSTPTIFEQLPSNKWVYRGPTIKISSHTAVL